MESNTTTTASNEKFLHDQVRWFLPEIRDVLKLSECLATDEHKAEFLEDSMKAIHKRLFKVLEATGTKSEKAFFLMSKKYDTRHGGPFDRGSADSYYRRGVSPHYYKADTGSSDKVEAKDMTEDQLDAYFAGFQENEASGFFKEY